MASMKKQNIVWLDVETTGVEENEGDKLLQVALLVTDEAMNVLDGSEFEVKIHYSTEEVEAMKLTTDEYVVNMHNATNLWNLLPVEGIPMAEAEAQLLAHLRKFVPEAKSARIAGNSITLDRNFLRKNMRELFEHLHYRSFDASTISGLAETLAPSELLYQKPKSTHEAMQDIRDSVDEMRYYRELIKPVFDALVAGSQSDSE